MANTTCRNLLRGIRCVKMPVRMHALCMWRRLEDVNGVHLKSWSAMTASFPQHHVNILSAKISAGWSPLVLSVTFGCFAFWFFLSITRHDVASQSQPRFRFLRLSPPSSCRMRIKACRSACGPRRPSPETAANLEDLRDVQDERLIMTFNCD